MFSWVITKHNFKKFWFFPIIWNYLGTEHLNRELNGKVSKQGIERNFSNLFSTKEQNRHMHFRHLQSSYVRTSNESLVTCEAR